MFDESVIVFDAFGTNGQSLLRTLQRHAPQASNADFNYTNAPISMEEIERRIDEAMKPHQQWRFRDELAEFAVHSPQRDHFEALLGGKLGSESVHELRAALAVVEAMESPSHSKKLTRLLSHEDEEIRHWAGRVLLEHGGQPFIPETLQSIGHADQRTRFQAFAALVKHSSLEPPVLDALSNRVEAVLAEFGANAFPESYNGNRVRLSAERRAQIWPLVQRIAEECGTNFVRNFPTPKVSSGR